jgi:formate hydrogenlyase subunit 3/multisubunit Na+/H+ antiporter MnhD subunit
MMLFELMVLSSLFCLVALIFKSIKPYIYLLLTPFIIGFAFALFVPIGFTQSVSWFLFGLHFKVDFIAKTFLLFTSFIWIISAVYAFFILQKKHQRRFWFWFLLTYLGNITLCFSDDAIGFYLFFSLMSLSAFGVIVHEQTKEAKKASFVYLKYAIVGEVAIFFGLVGLILDAQTMHFSSFHHTSITWAFWLLVLGFGIKVGVFLLHNWLPLAHSNAPAAASAVLSAVMLKAGVLGWMRFLSPYLNTDETVGLIFIVFGTLGILVGLYGLFEQKIKAVLAYSSISQMGFIVVMFGVSFYKPEHYDTIILALIFFMVHHAFNKAALFLLCHEIKMYGLKGINFIFALTAAVSLIGLPFTSGALAKTLLQNEISSMAVSAVFFMGSIVTALLMLRFFLLAKRIPVQIHKNSSSVMLILPLITSSLFMGFVVDFNYEFKFSAFLPIFIALIFLTLLKNKFNSNLALPKLLSFDFIKKGVEFFTYQKNRITSIKFPHINVKSNIKFIETHLHQEAIVFSILLMSLTIYILWLFI